MCEAHCGFNCAITPANNQNSFVDVVIRFDQAVHHLGKIFSFDPKFSWRTGPSERENDCVRAITGVLRNDGEYPVFASLDVLDPLAGAHFEVGTMQNLVPESEQILFGEFRLLE